MKTYIMTTSVDGERLSFEVSAANEQLARLRLAELLAKDGCQGRDEASWREEILARDVWLAIDKAGIIAAPGASWRKSIERLNAARKAWSDAKQAIDNARSLGSVLVAGDAADVAHDAYLTVLDDVTKELYRAWDVAHCGHCYGTGLEPDGDPGLEFTWCCEACAGDGMARKRQRDDGGPDNYKDDE